jgi:phosphoribosylformylglycinamidine (FGAM) synthase PurS component
MTGTVTVTLKPGVLDPQGEAIQHAPIGFAIRPESATLELKG